MEFAIEHHPPANLPIPLHFGQDHCSLVELFGGYSPDRSSNGGSFKENKNFVDFGQFSECRFVHDNALCGET